MSPLGLSILISHHPPRLSIHSIQDGRQERSVSFPSTSSSGLSRDFRITGVWWHKHENPPKKEPEMPDFFKRNKTIVRQIQILCILHYIEQSHPVYGSARLRSFTIENAAAPRPSERRDSAHHVRLISLVIFALLRLALRTSDLFSFQGVLPTSTAKAPKLPDSIANWPSLPPDLIAASIKPSPRPGDPQRRPGGPPEEVLDDVRPENSPNYDSLVIATDDQCRCHFFMDATFPLGYVSIGQVAEGVACEVVSLMNPPFRAVILAHVTYRVREQGYTNLAPISVDLSALRTPQTREVARCSSAARELAWYMMRVVEEMRTAWMGSAEHGEGARALGPKWVKEVEARQRVHSAGTEPSVSAVDARTHVLAH